MQNRAIVSPFSWSLSQGRDSPGIVGVARGFASPLAGFFTIHSARHAVREQPAQLVFLTYRIDGKGVARKE